MLSHRWAELESSRICVIRMAARKGRQPKVMLMALYLPVRRIIHLERNVEFEVMRSVKVPTRRAKKDPVEIKKLFGSKCNPVHVTNKMKKFRLSAIEVSPAVDADDNMTVWSHVGKKYVAERLQTATRALLQPTRTGTFLSRKLAAN